MLSLNASIEAARAGEAGRGFSVHPPAAQYPFGFLQRILPYLSMPQQDAQKKPQGLFFNTGFYRNALASPETAGYAHYEYDGVAYLYIFSKVSDSGAMICGRIPESTIMETASNIHPVRPMQLRCFRPD